METFKRAQLARRRAAAMSDVRDEIARLRYEAKRLRGYARLRREELRQLRSRPLESRDPIAELRARSRLNEYVQAAKQCDQRVTTLLRAETRSVAEGRSDE